MRTEPQMMELILGIAQSDSRIRAVYMNGSRTNPNAKKDLFQDYDVVYVVRETASFVQDKTWIDRFGERLYLQYPEESAYHPQDTTQCYGWLIQLADGNRIDLHVDTEAYAQRDACADTLCRVLLDKDGILPDIPAATDRTHWVQRPTQEQFLCTCNEFWWCLNNMGKGLWRNEVPYAQDILNLSLRPQLIIMLGWQVGTQTGFSCSIGKSGKDLWKWLSANAWERFLQTYAGGSSGELWDAVKALCRLFDETAKEVADQLGFWYNTEEAQASFGFLMKTEQLPADAQEIC